MTEESAPVFNSNILIRSRDNTLRSYNVMLGPEIVCAEIEPTTDISPLLAPFYSNDGRFLCLISEIVRIQDLQISSTIEIPVTNVVSAQFSPGGNYLITWSRPTDSEPNFSIWDISNSSPVPIVSYLQKTMKSNSIQFTDDERIFCRLVKNEVQIIETRNPTTPLARLNVKGVTQFSVSPVSTPLMTLALFVPEVGGNPAHVSLYRYGKQMGSQAEGPIATRSMFTASEARLSWSSQGSSLLVHTHSDVDRSGSSYYGLSGLFLLSTDGQSSIITSGKGGLVHDAQWAPQGDRFVIAAGSMPAQVTMFNAQGQAIYEFGSAHRNTISWSPHGRFLCLAGFGNLAGEMDFWDTQRLRKMGSNTSHCAVSHGWSPDSRLFLTATLTPRMNVDNGFKIFKYNGQGPVAKIDLDLTLNAFFRPSLPSTHPNRGPSPKRGGEKETDDSSPSPSSPSEPSPKAGKYRPPGSSGASFLSRDSGPKGKVKPEGGGGGGGGGGMGGAGKKPIALQRNIPGLAPTPTPLPNQNKKNPSSSSSSSSRLKEPASPPPPPLLTTPPPPPPPLTEEEKEKRLKNLKKKLKQVEELKAKVTGGGLVLNPEQTEKLNSEESLRAEIAMLEKKEVEEGETLSS